MTVLAVVWHEAGHVILARFVGYQVLAWGVGTRSVWWRRRLGRTWFYLGRPLTGGLTLFRPPLVDTRPGPLFLVVLGGPLFSALGLAASMALWLSGMHASWLSAWIFASALFTLLSAVPFSLGAKYYNLANDARRLIEIVRFRGASKARPLGTTLAMHGALADLLEGAGNVAGARYFRLCAGAIEAQLGNHEAAQKGVQQGLGCDASEIDSAPALTAFIRAVAAVEADADDSPEWIAAAATACATDATVTFMLDCLTQQWRLGRGDDIRPATALLRERAANARRYDWQRCAEQLWFEAFPAENAEKACREFLLKFEGFVPDTERARVLALTTERLAASGDWFAARALFAESQQSINAAAANIRCPASRQAYLRRAAQPLERALAAESSRDTPLFVGGIPDRPTPVQSSQFSLVSLVLGFMALGIAGVAVSNETIQGPHDPSIARLGIPLLVGTVTGNVLMSLCAVLYRERRWRLLLLGWCLSALGLGMGVAIRQHEMESPRAVSTEQAILARPFSSNRIRP